LTPTQLEAPKWTAQEFERLVLDCKSKVAVFDCDGTLWSGDSGSGFMVWSQEQGLVSRSTSDWIDTRHRAYQQGHVSELQICGEMVQIYAGLREQELRAAAAQYVEKFVRHRAFAEMVSLVANLRQAGVELWAVSSTNKWVVAEGVRDFGIPEGRVLAGKAATLRRVGLDRPDAAFGNSIHDLAMLQIARCPFPVNPSPALLQAAARNGWGYFRPQNAEGVAAAVAGE
jgi:phosphoserine phosphatase